MVPQNGVSRTNEQQRNHEKRSSAAAAIRRGNIQISNPIPEPITWVEGLVPDAPSQHPLGSHIVSPGLEEEQEGDYTHGLAVSTNEVQTREPLSHPNSKGLTQSIRETAHSQALNTPVGPTPDQRDSFITVSLPNQMDAKKKRRSGTIRTVLRKVFGRKEKTQSKQFSPTLGPGPKHEHSRSEPIPSTPTKLASIRSHEELCKQNPLRSQPADEYASLPVMTPTVLPFPMNINAPDPSASPSNYLSFETGPRVHRRRATLPSIVLSSDDAAALQKLCSSSDFRSTSSGTQTLGQSLPSPGIGMAFTSTKPENPNRRSRSASALRDLSTAQDLKSNTRRLSSEIRYWRTSRVDMEQLENDRRVSTSSECRSDNSNIAASVHNSVTAVSDAFADTGSSFHADNVNAFDFVCDATEPSSADKNGNVVEARLSQLEYNMQRLSISMQEATHQTTLKPFVLEKAPTQRKSYSTLNSSRNGLPSDSKGAVLPKRKRSTKQYTQARAASAGQTLPSPYPTSSSSGRYSPLASTMLSSGPAQMVRPSTSQAIPQARTAIMEETAPSPLIYDQLAPLYQALRYERSVRKGLETQVEQLRRDVFELGKVITQLRGNAGYPTPSPDVTLHHEVLQRSERNRFSGYDSDDDEGKELAEKWACPREETVARSWGRVSPEGEMF
ncbi:hypothetical protein E2P81_ATG06451 [Venturia nashicola]|uniref:Uncharacterized protein n=1 Tax=Venturia nashicola TaxID=86259 RepID=A0A4Z1PAM2_9PEZI|nr:hypothetical protein E6O75_ATG06612 [Venturia nashicola]TLD28105.1 hypothetical protein E2P81_ATG06451 [Venturia nashicola]